MIDLKNATFLKIDGHNKGTKKDNKTWEYYDCLVVDKSTNIHRIRAFPSTHRRAILDLKNGDRVSFTNLEVQVYNGKKHYKTTLKTTITKKNGMNMIIDKLDEIIELLKR